MKAKHPPQANPNRGYSYVGQENVAKISGYEKGRGPGQTRDIKVSNHPVSAAIVIVTSYAGNLGYGICTR